MKLFPLFLFAGLALAQVPDTPQPQTPNVVQHVQLVQHSSFWQTRRWNEPQNRVFCPNLTRLHFRFESYID